MFLARIIKSSGLNSVEFHEKDDAFPSGECVFSILASSFQKWKVKLAENPCSLGVISGF